MNFSPDRLDWLQYNCSPYVALQHQSLYWQHVKILCESEVSVRCVALLEGQKMIRITSEGMFGGFWFQATVGPETFKIQSSAASSISDRKKGQRS